MSERKGAEVGEAIEEEPSHGKPVVVGEVGAAREEICDAAATSGAAADEVLEAVAGELAGGEETSEAATDEIIEGVAVEEAAADEIIEGVAVEEVETNEAAAGEVVEGGETSEVVVGGEGKPSAADGGRGVLDASRGSGAAERSERSKKNKRSKKSERREHEGHGLRERSALGRALVQFLNAGALMPEHAYSRRGFRARLRELRPATAEADLAAVVRAQSGGGALPGVEVHSPQGRQIRLSLGREQRGQVSIHQGDNLQILAGMGDGSVDLIYIDPPFNTGIMQTRTRLKTARDDEGDRVGFRGERYRSVRLGTHSFADTFDDYLGFLAPRLEHAHRLLRAGGSLFLHLDFREVHYAKVLLDQIFGRASFINEIIWAYDYGGRTTKRWPPKHDNILWYARDPEHYCFNYDAIDRIPYMAPGLVGKAKAARGKTPTDTWWHTIVSPGSREKNGYPTQKPLGILHRIVRVHTQPGDTILDFFAGSGSIGESAAMHGRHTILIDRSPEAIAVMKERLARFEPVVTTVI